MKMKLDNDHCHLTIKLLNKYEQKLFPDDITQ